MPSSYPKFLSGITINDDNNTLVGSDTGGAFTATIPSADYDTILELLDELDDQMSNEGNGTYTAAVSSIGIITISCDEEWDITWANTDDDLSTLLGFDETEEVDGSDVLTATLQHQKGWYPGLLSFAYATNKGSGITADKRWELEWEGNRLFAGTGAISALYPNSPLYQRDITVSPLHKDEIDNTTIGVTAFINNCIAITFRWYPDRTDGVVATPGTQNTDYWLVSFVDNPDWRNSNRHPDWFDMSLLLNREPV